MSDTTPTIPKASKGDGWVLMQHPDIPGRLAEVTEKAFADVWAPKGWTKTADHAGHAGPDLTKVS